MADDPQTVECDNHGTRRAAYVCRHLAAGDGLGFYWGIDPGEPNSPCPDAWCEACETVLERHGEWNDAAAAHAGITLICAECYVDIRARNWAEDNAAFEQLAVDVSQALQDKQARLWQQYEIDKWARWDWFVDSQQLVFSHEDKPRVVCTVAFVGTHATSNGSWMWSWANPSFPDEVRDALAPVRRFGEEENFMKLAAGYWRADDDDGWLMTAFVTRLLGGVGGYRTPNDSGHTYMAILDAAWAQ